MQNGFQQKHDYSFSLPFLTSFLFLIILLLMLAIDATC